MMLQNSVFQYYKSVKSDIESRKTLPLQKQAGRNLTFATATKRFSVKSLIFVAWPFCTEMAW